MASVSSPLKGKKIMAKNKKQAVSDQRVIANTSARLFEINTLDKNGRTLSVKLRPGLNSLSSELFNRIKKVPFFQALEGKGMLAVSKAATKEAKHVTKEAERLSAERDAGKKRNVNVALEKPGNSKKTPKTGEDSDLRQGNLDKVIAK